MMKSPIKQLALSLLFIVFAISSCKVGMYSEAKGKPQEAYLQIIQSQTKYPDGVEIIIDEQPPFIAKVDKEKKMKVKGNLCTIPTGRHRLRVLDKGKLVFDKEIFTSSQEVKQIQIP